MRIVFRILKWLGALLLVLVALIAAWPWVAVVRDQFGSEPYRTWLAEHRTVLDPARDDYGFDLPQAAGEARFIILSEVHGFDVVQDIDLALLKHVNERFGTRTYLAEVDPAMALAFNMVVTGRDDAPAREIFDRWAETGTQWGNAEFFAKLEAIRDLNETLPEDRRILFVGVDKVSDADWARGVPERALADLEGEATPGFGSYAGVQAINAALLEDALARDEDAGRYENIVPNIATLETLEGFADENFYGLWGLFHGSKSRINGAEPLALRLGGEGGTFEGGVFTIGTLCIEDCLNMMPSAALPGFLTGDDGEEFTALPLAYDQTYISRVSGVGDLKAVMGEDRLAMFGIAGEGSPYAQKGRLTDTSGYLAMLWGFEFESGAAAAYDHVVAIRGSGPVTPWKGRIYTGD